MRQFTKDELQVQIYPSRAEMGKAAAEEMAVVLKKLLKSQDNVRMIFASAPSQNDFFIHLATIEDIDFSRVTAFHLDEYIGLPADAPQGFGNFLKERLFSKLSPLGEIHFIDSQAQDPQAECDRYAALLNAAPIDIVCMGIGENAHIAFNDPPVADFNDPKLVKIVELDQICRQQQVNDGCFASLDLVPTHAVTLTVPAIMRGKAVFCMVPGPTKANAVYNTLEKEITTAYPSSILRMKQGAVLYLDTDSAVKL